MKYKSFLECVAEDLIGKFGTDLSHVAVVFPNKRASLFFNICLGRLCKQPMWSPSYITISELFRRHSSKTVADQIKLVCDLHKSYNDVTGLGETLDNFYGWGQLMLSDFDDLDKNEGDPRKVFANVADLREMDNVDYLTEEQRKTLKRFFANFSEDKSSQLKERFLTLWSHMYDIYNDFNARLEAQGLAYEGALYREVANCKSLQFQYDKYIFVGFNLLQRVEQKLFETIDRQGKALFYWDYDRYYMNENNEAGRYIRRFLEHFPNQLDNNDGGIYDNFAKEKEVTYISAPTETIQARYISQWLKERQRYKDGRKTAIVLCDEGLLPTVVHCIPEEVDKLNVTTGFPLSQTPAASFVSQLIALQDLGYDSKRQRFRLHYVNSVLRHPYAVYVDNDVAALCTSLNNRKVFYPSLAELGASDNLKTLFTIYSDCPKSEANLNIARWLLQLLRIVAMKAAEKEDALVQESLFRAYTLINRVCQLIESGDLAEGHSTFRHLIMQLMASTSIPFHGEPAIGVQVMGLLETRNLDFDHVLLLSCNEGKMPKGVDDTSFIPHSIRKSYELTTIDNKVAIYAYYFYNLMQRAKDITIVYNNAKDDLQKGEMSRFMLQMLVESNHKISLKTLGGGQETDALQPCPIQKNGEVMQRLHSKFLTPREDGSPQISPTALSTYLRCPLQFYYRHVCGIREPDEYDEDEIDNRIFGNIFHEAADIIYHGIGKDGEVTANKLQQLLNNRMEIERAVDLAFKRKLFLLDDDVPFKMELNGLQLINRDVIIKFVRKLLRIDRQIAPFSIVGLECDACMPVTVSTPEGDFCTTIGGRIDRLDMITDKEMGRRIRVIDYKTGTTQPYGMKGIDDIFNPANIDKHSDYYLQTFLYSLVVGESPQLNVGNEPVSPALLFIQKAVEKDFDPTLTFDIKEEKKKKEVVKVKDVAQYASLYRSKLNELLTEIFSGEIPFNPTPNTKRCELCAFRQMCGRRKGGEF